MKSEKLTKKFETLLKGRSFLDLHGHELYKADTLLEEIAKEKPLNKLTEIERKAITESLIDILRVNLFIEFDKIPNDWAQRTLTILGLENYYNKEQDYNLEEIFNQYLDGMSLWEILGLSRQDRKAVAKDMVEYLFKLKQEQSVNNIEVVTT